MKYVNNTTGAPRPEFTPFGTVVSKGKYSTRRGPKKYFTYDGRLRTKVAISETDVKVFKKPAISTHACVELAKGILMKAPHLINASSELKLAAAAMQLDPTLSKSEILRFMSKVPLLRLLGAFSAVINHDGDLERKHNYLWWQWQDKDAGDSKNQTNRVNRVLLNGWCHKAKAAMKSVEIANESRDAMTANLKAKLPVLAVTTNGTKTPLTGGAVAKAMDLI